MNKEFKQELLNTFKSALQPLYTAGFKSWCEDNIVLPYSYAIPGKLDLSISPYLHKPMEAIDNPRIEQVNLCCATQIGKSLFAELYIPYTIINNPGPVFRIFNNQEVSDLFTTTRLVPMLKLCEPIKPLLKYDRFSTGKKGVSLPHTNVVCGSSNTALAHGYSVKYLLCDELWTWDAGQFGKFKARTTAFSGRRKIICSSQPGKTGSEWETICFTGPVYDWQWLCPKCNTRQTFYWSKEKEDGTYAGMNWDSILNTDDTSNIAESSKTAHLACCNCDHKVHDTPTERLQLNQQGEYVCTKREGNPAVVTYMAPCWVNPNISFASKAAEYMIAKRTKKLTGLDELMEAFVEQSLGKFYKREEQADLSKILVELYDKDSLAKDKDWINIMSVDVQRTGGVKYYVVRAWHRNGNESRRLDFGIARTYEELEAIRIKYNVPLPLFHIDSGDGSATSTIYQECIKHGKVIKTNLGLQYVSWTPTKGDGNKISYKHPDGITKLYSPVSPQDANFPIGHKLRGIPAELILFSNYSIKTILANLRDNRIEGVKWLIDRPDEEYDKQLYSEGIFDVVDKKSGIMTKRWLQTGNDNHYLDTEVMNLLGAMRANVFSATKISEEDIRKIIDSTKKD